MKMNSTHVTYLILASYFEIGPYKYAVFVFLLCLYVSIIVANLLLIVLISMNRSLHEPMYLFMCSLFMNELYGSTGLFPLLLFHILSYVHQIYFPLCFLQIFCIYTYVCIGFLNLTLMSYDRYQAICHPLQYNTHMTFKKVVILIAAVWLFPTGTISVLISLTLSLQLCGNIINNVYCDNFSVVKLSCSDTRVNNIYGLVHTVVVVIFPVIMILVTYVKILKVCFSGSKQTRQKAVITCTPHLATLINFSFGVCFEVLQSRFDMSHVPNILRIFLSSYFLTCQPLFSPLVYGLQLSKLRKVYT